MSARGWCPGDFDPGLFDVLSGASEMADRLRRAAFRMAAAQGGPGPGGPGGHWKGGFGGPKGAGRWGGGGAWGAWWPGPGGPGGATRSRKAGRGDVRAAILALLREGPRTGYQIMSDIEDRSDGAWRPSPGAVYPALAQLADEGLIVGEESGGRRTFSLTDAGREYVERNPDMARGAWESREQQEAWQVPGLFAEAARLGAGIMQITHVGTPDQVREAERLLERTRRRLYQILAEDSDDEDSDEGETDDGDESREDDDGDE
jgi:DNA-binding PadR family transcriptional regulator